MDSIDRNSTVCNDGGMKECSLRELVQTNRLPVSSQLCWCGQDTWNKGTNFLFLLSPPL